jgi:hypothetical protein
MQLPQFKVLERGEQPPDEGYHVLLVHRFSSDWRALVHDITSRVPPSAGKVCHLTGRNASGHTVRAFHNPRAPRWQWIKGRSQPVGEPCHRPLCCCSMRSRGD